MPKHKWHDEIIAWAKGQAVQYRTDTDNQWFDFSVCDTPQWHEKHLEFRVKPEPLEFVVLLDPRDEPLEIHDSGADLHNLLPEYRSIRVREIPDES